MSCLCCSQTTSNTFDVASHAVVWGHGLVVLHRHTLSACSCFANSRHIRRDVAFCQSMQCQQSWHDSSMLLHYDVHVNDHEQASIVTYILTGKLFVHAWR